MDWIFNGCYSLQEVKLGENFAFIGEESYLPISEAEYPDGYWYNTQTNVGYLPEEIPSNTAATYTAIPIIKNRSRIIFTFRFMYIFLNHQTMTPFATRIFVW